MALFSTATESASLLTRLCSFPHVRGARAVSVMGRRDPQGAALLPVAPEIAEREGAIVARISLRRAGGIWICS